MQNYLNFLPDCFSKTIFWPTLFLGAIIVTTGCEGGCCCEESRSVSCEKKQLIDVAGAENKLAITTIAKVGQENIKPLVEDISTLTSNQAILLPSMLNNGLGELDNLSPATTVLMPEIVDPKGISLLGNRENNFFADMESEKIKEGYWSFPKEEKRNTFVKKQLPLGLKSISTVITAGPNISFKSSKEDYGSTKYKHKPGVGFQVGVGSKMVFNDKWSVCPALIVKQNNASEELTYTGTGGEPGGTTTKDKYSYTYLSVPVLAEYKVSEQLSVVAGPELNYLLGSSVKPDGGKKESLTKNSVKVGVGAQVGVKYAIPSRSGNSAWNIQLIYDHRISRLNKKEMDYGGGTGGYEVPAWNMKSVQLGVTCLVCNLLKAKNKN